MSLASFPYLCFFLLVVGAANVWPRDHVRAKQTFLVIVSYVFYATFAAQFLLVLIGITAIAYFGGLLLGTPARRSGRTALLPVFVVLCLIPLIAFKYFPFLQENFLFLLGVLGLSPQTRLVEWLLPIGISFYSFLAVSYLVDVHRGQCAACKSPVQVALYLSFFPHLLSGPITRANALMPQIAVMPRASAEQARAGVLLLMRGYVKKIVFADVLGAYFVAPAFDITASQSAGALLVGLYAYTFQVYFDLSGYTDIARGTGKLLGLELARNFDRPYLATSVSNFWGRWHISMSSFFRDYLYFALGGSKRGNVYVNLMITFIAIGIWHGAGWNFVVYGALHGLAVSWERARRARKRDGSRSAPIWFQIATTFHFVVFSRILFREDDIGSAWEYVQGLLSGVLWNAESPSALLPWSILAVAVALHFTPRRWQVRLSEYLYRRPAVVVAGVIVCTSYVLIAMTTSQAPFIYFRF